MRKHREIRLNFNVKTQLYSASLCIVSKRAVPRAKSIYFNQRFDTSEKFTKLNPTSDKAKP